MKHKDMLFFHFAIVRRGWRECGRRRGRGGSASGAASAPPPASDAGARGNARLVQPGPTRRRAGQAQNVARHISFADAGFRAVDATRRSFRVGVDALAVSAAADGHFPPSVVDALSARRRLEHIRSSAGRNQRFGRRDERHLRQGILVRSFFLSFFLSATEYIPSRTIIQP